LFIDVARAKLTKKLTIALLFGGISSEREVSLNSGRQVYEALDKDKYDILRYDPKTDLPRLVADAARIDAALIILHGAFGEDGTVQGLLDLLGIPYQGSGVLGSAVAMNKLAAKRLYQQAGLPIPDFIVARRGRRLTPGRWRGGWGCRWSSSRWVGGSSVGITIVRNPQELDLALGAAYAHDASVLIEAHIQGRRLPEASSETTSWRRCRSSKIIPDRSRPFFDYEAKYTDGVTQEICPARIDERADRQGPAAGDGGHRALFCRGYSGRT